eukprot:2199330-Rhodomonas_salina.4
MYLLRRSEDSAKSCNWKPGNPRVRQDAHVAELSEPCRRSRAHVVTRPDLSIAVDFELQQLPIQRQVTPEVRGQTHGERAGVGHSPLRKTLFEIGVEQADGVDEAVALRAECRSKNVVLAPDRTPNYTRLPDAEVEGVRELGQLHPLQGVDFRHVAELCQRPHLDRLGVGEVAVGVDRKHFARKPRVHVGARHGRRVGALVQKPEEEILVVLLAVPEPIRVEPVTREPDVSPGHRTAHALDAKEDGFQTSEEASASCPRRFLSRWTAPGA